MIRTIRVIGLVLWLALVLTSSAALGQDGNQPGDGNTTTTYCHPNDGNCNPPTTVPCHPNDGNCNPQQCSNDGNHPHAVVGNNYVIDGNNYVPAPIDGNNWPWE